jgi:hypothetical protein
MSETRRLMRLGPKAAVKEKRLAALLESAPPEAAAALDRALEEAQVRGSLALAEAETRGPLAPGTAERLARARRSVEGGAPLTVAAIRTWHRELTGVDALRARERPARPDGPPPAPVAFVESRLAILEQWMQVESGRELKPSQQGALVLARLVEIAPFEEDDGLVARLAASHVVVRAGGRPPILVAEDAPRLAAALGAAFRLDTEPLTAVFDEASERALDVLLQALGPAR